MGHFNFDFDPDDFRIDPDVFRFNPDDFRIDPDVFRFNPDAFRIDPSVFRFDPDDFRIDPDVFRFDPDDFRIDPDVFRIDSDAFFLNFDPTNFQFEFDSTEFLRSFDPSRSIIMSIIPNIGDMLENVKIDQIQSNQSRHNLDNYWRNNFNEELFDKTVDPYGCVRYDAYRVRFFFTARVFASVLNSGPISEEMTELDKKHIRLALALAIGIALSVPASLIAAWLLGQTAGVISGLSLCFGASNFISSQLEDIYSIKKRQDPSK
ncbi:hypothetical protein [Natrinema salinisoli]|uniref:hypothetical protein n=1 Tax=Natrinema salinisoli TaxID=2878535 RepID=UPI001CEFEA79|nr:hypothetical protein [Natrinema salinisoli]